MQSFRIAGEFGSGKYFEFVILGVFNSLIVLVFSGIGDLHQWACTYQVNIALLSKVLY